MSGQYNVTRVEGGYRIGDVDQVEGGFTVTDAWLKEMEFWPLTRLNVEHVVRACMAGGSGMILSPHKLGRVPKDVNFTPGFKSFPSDGRGLLPRNPKQLMEASREQQRTRMRIPERMLIRG